MVESIEKYTKYRIFYSYGIIESYGNQGQHQYYNMPAWESSDKFWAKVKFICVDNKTSKILSIFIKIIK